MRNERESPNPEDMMNNGFPAFTAALAVAGLMTACGDSNANQPPTEQPLSITASDVAWATEWQIVKIDLSNAGAFYAIGLAVVDKDGNIYETSGGMTGYDNKTESDPPLIATVAIQRQDAGVDAKLRVGGTSVNSKLEWAFSQDNWFTLGEAAQIGDLYHLCGNSNQVGVTEDRMDVADDSRMIAVKLYRTEEEWDRK